MDLDTYLYDANEARSIDSFIFNSINISSYELMQMAAYATAHHILTFCKPSQDVISVVCGKGNNAGDGFCVALYLKKAGCSVKVVTLYQGDNYAPDARQAYDALLRHYPEIIVGEISSDTNILIDSIFGTGLNRSLDQNIIIAISEINALSATRVSIDIPTGLNASSGCIHGAAVNADRTLTFITNKVGLHCGRGRECVGTLKILPIVSEEVRLTAFKHHKPSAYLTHPSFLQKLPHRSEVSHKYKNGKVLVVGGYSGMTGAAILAAKGAFRVGAGLVVIMSNDKDLVALADQIPEAITIGHQSNWIQNIKDDGRFNAIVIGPGLGMNQLSVSEIKQLIQLNIPMVFDADALNMIANGSTIDLAGNIITPHIGEAARLLNTNPDHISEDSFCAARKLTEKYNCITVLKGPGTWVVSKKTEPSFINPFGNKGMATAGMGDVLAGVIGGLLGQGLSLKESATLGSMIHSCAADRAANERGQIGLMASDLFDKIQEIINERSF